MEKIEQNSLNKLRTNRIVHGGILFLLVFLASYGFGIIFPNSLLICVAIVKKGDKIIKPKGITQGKIFRYFLTENSKLDLQKIFATGTIVILYALICYLTYEDIYRVRKPLMSPNFIPKVCLPKDLLVSSTPCGYGPHTFTSMMLENFLKKVCRPELSPSFAYFILSEVSKNVQSNSLVPF